MSPIRWRRLWREFRSNFIFQVLSWLAGTGILGASGRVIWQGIHHVSPDWTFFGVFFGAGLTFLLIALWKKSEAEPYVSPEELERRLREQRQSITSRIPGILINGEPLGGGPTEPAKNDDLFTPLQMDAFRLAKNLRLLIDSAGPYPDKERYGYRGDTVPDDSSQLHAYHDARREVNQRLLYRYQRELAPRIKDLLLRAGGEGYPLFTTDWDQSIRDKDGFEKLAADLEMVALWFSRKDRRMERINQ